MNTNRKAAILAGALYFLGTSAGVFSVVPVIDIPDYLIQVSANASQVTSGAFFQFLMMAAYVGMAITLYPILKRHNESLALGYVGFRIVAAVFIIISIAVRSMFPEIKTAHHCRNHPALCCSWQAQRQHRRRSDVKRALISQ